MPQFSVVPYSIEKIISLIKAGEIAIPEIQRPFVWDSTKVRDLMDSLYKGFPVGYITVWQNPNIKLRDGSISSGKKILIDGQQRITAIQAAVIGHKILDKNYKKKRIVISFNPLKEIFEVCTPFIEKNSEWISDISAIFEASFDPFNFVPKYCNDNGISGQGSKINNVLRKLQYITTINIGVIELSHELEIDDVTDIFIRINSQGVALSSADFAMSKISSDEQHGGNDTRKMIDYFCRFVQCPGDFEAISENDKDFSNSDAMQKIKWAAKKNQNDIYVPTYEDLLRVAFTHVFKRGKIADLVSLLSGRNFKTRKNEESIVEDSFNKLREGVDAFVNQTNFECFLMIVKSVGIIDKSMLKSQNVFNFSYSLYLALKKEGIQAGLIEKIVRKWIVLSILTGRYSGTTETKFEEDIKHFTEEPLKYLQSVEEGELSDAFWNVTLVQKLNAQISNSPYFQVYVMAQIKNNARGFLSKNITVQSMIDQHGDKHHLFPKKYLIKNGVDDRKFYNQVANFAFTQSEINVAIKDKAPNIYMAQVEAQINGGEKIYGGISDRADLKKNLNENCIPEGFGNMDVSNYQEFLEARRKLMAHYIRDFYKTL